MLRPNLGAAHFWHFDQCGMMDIPHESVMQRSFTPLKLLLAAPPHSSLRLPPGYHGSLYCPHRSTVFRMSSSWSHRNVAFSHWPFFSCSYAFKFLYFLNFFRLFLLVGG